MIHFPPAAPARLRRVLDGFTGLVFCIVAMVCMPVLAGIGEQADDVGARLSIIELPAVENRGRQVAVRWSGTLPATLKVGRYDAVGQWRSVGEPIELLDSMTLLPAPSAAKDGSFRLLDAHGQVLASARTETQAIGWEGTFFGPGLDSTVRAVIGFEGDLIIAGNFTTAGEKQVNGIARWDGEEWSAFGTGMNGTVQALTIFDDDLIAGGSFTQAGGHIVNNIARWDGQEWLSLDSGMNDTVRALAIDDGDLIVGGSFSQAGGHTINNIARWDGQDWSGLGSGLSGSVQALTVHKGNLIAGGNFGLAGWQIVNFIARWDGQNWSGLGSGMNNAVYALAVNNGDLIAGGRFSQAGGQTVNRIARWDGEGWSGFGNGVAGVVRALAIHDGDLTASGEFLHAGGQAVNRIARWDGQSWSGLGDGMNNTVWALALFEGSLIAGGEFTSASGQTVNRIAHWEGKNWSGLGGPEGTGMNNSVRALAVHNGDLIAGGMFTEAGGQTVNRIARWDGESWSGLGGPEGTGMNNMVRALTVHNGDLIAGGMFTEAGGQAVNRIARWDGEGWTGVGNGVTGQVNELIVYNGDLIAGGFLGKPDRQNPSHVLRWDGEHWTGLGTGVDGTVTALIVYNGDLVAAGYFTAAGGETVNRIARWDGQSWSGFDGPEGPGMNDTVRALAVHDGDLVAAGRFTRAGGQTVNHIARWDGAQWSGLDGPDGAGVNQTVWALTIHDGDLIAGGYFTEAGGQAVNHVARWDGESWSGLDGPEGNGVNGPEGNGVNATVWTLGAFDGDLIAGGAFIQAGGQAAWRLARWREIYDMAEVNVDLVGDAAHFGSVSSEPEGLECDSWGCWGTFIEGTEVTLHAETEYENVAFTGWEGVDCLGLESCTVIAEGWIALDARFDYMAELGINLVGDAAGQGSVYSVPEGVECDGWGCWGMFHPGTEVTLHAETEYENVAFTGWEGVDCPGLGSCTVIAEGWIALDARFDYMAEVGINLVGDAAGQGSVYSVPEGVECDGWGCWGMFHPGTEVTLHAETEYEYVVFTGWEGVDCPGLGSCAVIAEGWIALDARFDYMAEVGINLIGDAAGQGSVYSVPEGVECDEWGCWGMFHPGTEVTLHAEVDNEEVAFTGWDGVDCPGLGSCTLVADEHMGISASFEYLLELELKIVGDGSGRVYSTSPEIDCPKGVCNTLLIPGTEITLIAEPEVPMHYFAGWMGVAGCSTESVCQFTIETDMEVTAEFLLLPDEVYLDRFEIE